MSIFSNRIIGALLLIVGTSIGAGMFALPIACSGVGFLISSIFIFLVWIIMLLGAFFILEVNLWFPKGNNMLTMAHNTLGVIGKAVTWVIYLLLLYTLMSAYISGGSDVLQSLLQLIGINFSLKNSISLFTLLFAFVIYQGINIVEGVNTALMILKILIYALLVFLISPHINLNFLSTVGEWKYLPSALLLLVTSFGFAIIIPSLREQFNDDIKTLRNVIFIGSLFPLVCYLLWNAVIMGVISRDGAEGLLALNQSDRAVSELTNDLSIMLKSSFIIQLFRGFSALGMLTAFLGVSLCMFDFLADSLRYKRRGFTGFALLMMCFLPPFLIVMIYPGAYVKALSYAGGLVVLLLILLPALMTCFGRYRLKLKSSQFKVPGGKFTVVFTIFASILLLLYSF